MTAISYLAPLRRVSRSAGLCLLLLGASGIFASAEAQGPAWDDPFLPGGTLLISPGLQFSYWTTRFGFRFDEDVLFEGEEPWGYPISDGAANSRMFPGEAALRDALGGEEYRLTLGAGDVLADAGVIRIPLKLGLGITDWLTVGVNLPLVRRKIRIDQGSSPDSASAGVSPTLTAPGEVSAFLGAFRASVASAASRVEAICLAEGETSAPCQDGRAVVADAEALFLALSQTFTASPVFALEGSAAAGVVTGRVDEVRAALEALGAGFEAALPLALAPMGDQYRASMLQEPVSGIASFHGEGWYNQYQFGDVELSADLRLLDFVRAASDEESGTPRLRIRAGVGGTLRLGTGFNDDASDWLDLGTVTGQNDYELRGFADIQALGWLGLSANYLYGSRGSAMGTAGWDSPVYAITVPMSGVPLTWEPGSYSTLILAPRLRIITGLSLAGDVAFMSRSQDRWTTTVTEVAILEGGETFPIPDPSYLAVPTDETRTRLGVGLVYSTLPAVAAGDVSLPLTLRARWEGALSGSGGRAPKASRISAELRVFWSLWGDG